MEDRMKIEQKGLIQAVTVIKEAIQRSQTRALQSVNHEILSLYYGVGRYVSTQSRCETWGTGIIKAISSQLQKEIPGLTGFGESSIKNMRKFYEEWSDFVNRQPTAADLQVDENLLLEKIRQPLVAEFDWSDFLRVPFTHHIEILL